VKGVMKILTVVAALAVAAPAAHAADGLLILEKTATGATTQTHQIQIEKDRMRAETTGAAGEKQAMLFDAAKQVMWIVNYDKKTYSEITKADIDRLGGQMTDAMAKMQQQMQNLPPEQRAKMEAMMAGRGGMRGAGAGAAAKTEYKKTGTDTVGQWTCDKYEGSRSGQKTSELCTVDPQTLGFTAADFEVSRQLQAFFSKITPQGAENMFRIGSAEDQGFSGVPVRRVSFGASPTTSEITAVTRQHFPDSTFAVPDGFQKEASPFGGRGR
jgi:Domain of unknown function (DUF4412)